jgi:hypothetical protein
MLPFDPFVLIYCLLLLYYFLISAFVWQAEGGSQLSNKGRRGYRECEYEGLRADSASLKVAAAFSLCQLRPCSIRAHIAVYWAAELQLIHSAQRYTKRRRVGCDDSLTVRHAAEHGEHSESGEERSDAVAVADVVVVGPDVGGRGGV